MINNLGKYAHPPKQGGRNISKGRHAVGANPAPGSGIKPPNRSGQSEPVGNKPITGGKTEMKPRNPSTALNTTTAMKQQIATPPVPFKTSAGIANMSAPATMPYGSTFKHTPGLQRSAAPKNPPAGPVGGFKPKTLSHAVGYKTAPKKNGAMTASAKKGGHSLLYGD